MFLKKLKIILWFTFPTLVFFAGLLFFFNELTFRKNYSSISEKDFAALEIYGDSLKNLETYLNSLKAREWNTENLQSLFKQFNVNVDYFQMESSSSHGQVSGTLSELLLLLGALSEFAPHMILHNFSLVQKRNIYQLNFSLGPLTENQKIPSENFSNYNDIVKRWTKEKIPLFQNKEIKFSKKLKKSSEKFQCKAFEAKILGTLSGHACVVKTNQGNKLLSIGDSISTWKLDSVTESKVRFVCYGTVLEKEIKK